MNHHRQIVPSILAANFAHLEQEVRRVTSAGASILHMDIMDGHFVPNISFGPLVVRCVNAISNVPLDTHLMVANPEEFIEEFKDAGSDIITFHIEASPDPVTLVKKIKKMGMKAGITLKPETPITMLENVLPHVNMALVMSVPPGFGGQRFMESSLEKISFLRDIRLREKLDFVIEIDGGINQDTIESANDAGAEYFVTGSAIFKDGNIEQNFNFLTEIISEDHE